MKVTTIGERDALEREAIAAKKHWHVAGARWAWMIHVGDRVVMRDLERHLPSLVLMSERLGVPDPRLVPYEEQQVEAFRWFDKNAVSMCGIPESRRHGKIDMLPDGGGGAVFEHLDELPAWLSARLREPDLHDNIEKLKATGRSELHLFLRIHDTAMPFSLYYPLAWGGCVPASALDAPAALTGLWLAPAWHNPILWWSTADGWARADCLD